MKEYIFEIHEETTVDGGHPSKMKEELIRCKDCLYADSYYHCIWANFWGTADDYCSRAKPKINEDK